MAHRDIHLEQARHNESCAAFLLASAKPFHDWGVTAAFYSAVHLYEGWLYDQAPDQSKKHTETSIPRSSAGEQQSTPHAWRESKIRSIGKEAFKSYRHLKVASETARYLSIPGHVPGYAQQIAPLQISIIDAKAYIEQDLPAFKAALKLN